MDLIELRPAIVFVHVIAAFGFVLAHGVALFVGFALRRDPDPARVRHLLDLSAGAYPAFYLALLIALVTGIVAALIAGQFGQLWPWASIVIVVVTFLGMYAMGSEPLTRIRQAVGIRTRLEKKDDPDPAPRSADDVRALVTAFRPEAVTAIGLVSLVVLIWLMRFRPF